MEPQILRLEPQDSDDVVQNDKLNHRMEVTGGVLEDSCRLFTAVFNDLRQS